MVKSQGLLSSDKITKASLLRFFQSLDDVQPLKKSRLAYLGFFEPSTRTKASFFAAGIDLHLDWFDLKEEELSLKKGESLRDTLVTLSQYRPALMVVRDSRSGFPFFAQHWLQCPVINGGDGSRDHPTQGLLDALTIWEWSKKPRSIGFWGDIVRSRVFRSTAHCLRLMGHRLSLISDGDPETLELAKAFDLNVMQRKDIQKLDLLIALRVQTERGSSMLSRPLSPEDLGQKTLLMHPGPVIIGQDFSRELILWLENEGKNRSLILDQVRNGLRVRRKVLSEVLRSGGQL